MHNAKLLFCQRYLHNASKKNLIKLGSYQYNFILTINNSSEGGPDNTPIFNGKISFTSTVSDWDGPTDVNITQP